MAIRHPTPKFIQFNNRRDMRWSIVVVCGDSALLLVWQLEIGSATGVYVAAGVMLFFFSFKKNRTMIAGI